MTLEQPSFIFKPADDSRKRMEEPLPVNLEAVADMHLPKPTTTTDALDRLYVGILEFQKATDRAEFAYHADNFDLVFDLIRPQGQNDYRPVKIIVRSLADTERKLVEAELEFTRQKSLLPGHDALVMRDIQGNWLEIREHREIG